MLPGTIIQELEDFVGTALIIVIRVPTNLENLELSGNFVNLEKSGKFFNDMSVKISLLFL